MDTEVIAESSASKNPNEEKQKIKKKMPPGSIQLQFAGELILARCRNKEYKGFFRRYEALLESFANMDREERMINYKFLNALILTSHAKKSTDAEDKKKLFELKNRIFLDIANNRESRKKVGLKYLNSSHFRVIEYCADCTKTNTEQDLPRFKWKFCTKCKVDRTFYNVLSMLHKFPDGTSSIFLSHDRINQVRNVNTTGKARREDFTEEVQYKNFHYNVRNLDAIDRESMLKMYEKLMNEKPDI